MSFLLASVVAAGPGFAQTGQAIDAAYQLFGPLGVILGSLMIFIIGSMMIAIRRLWARLEKVQERNNELTDKIQNQSEEMAEKVNGVLRDILHMMDDLETNIDNINSKFQRRNDRTEDSIDKLKAEVIQTIREQND
jgi:septation ring formation regulator EzrA